MRNPRYFDLWVVACVFLGMVAMLGVLGFGIWVGQSVAYERFDRHERYILDYSACRGQPFDATTRAMHYGRITIEEIRQEVDEGC